MISFIQKRANGYEKNIWYATLFVVVISSNQSYYFYNLLEQLLVNIFKDLWNSFFALYIRAVEKSGLDIIQSNTD